MLLNTYTTTLLTLLLNLNPGQDTRETLLLTTTHTLSLSLLLPLGNRLPGHKTGSGGLITAPGLMTPAPVL